MKHPSDIARLGGFEPRCCRSIANRATSYAMEAPHKNQPRKTGYLHLLITLVVYVRAYAIPAIYSIHVSSFIPLIYYINLYCNIHYEPYIDLRSYRQRQIDVEILSTQVAEQMTQVDKTRVQITGTRYGYSWHCLI